ncbi:MAG: glycosyltransferase family 4 protein [Phycisphaeraceae bacterium]|nr:glycosyltransferase family 4 protein [Phycisphaeraceae bacterium]
MIRVTIQQPGLAQYRRPVYAVLAKRQGIVPLVLYDHKRRGGPPLVEPEGFQAAPVTAQRVRTPLGPLLWHSAHFRAVNRKEADVAILSWSTRYLSLFPALIKARLAGVPVILWGHGFSKSERSIKRWLRNLPTRLAAATLFYNHTAAQRFIDETGRRESTFVALNALDQAPIQEARRHWLDRPEELAAFRERENLTAGRTILFVSRLDAPNHLDWLLDATAILAADMPELRVVIIGNGEPEKGRLQSMVRERELERHVRFLGAIYREPELAPWFLCSDVFCYPANIGLSILHAFGYGLPVVTSDRTESQNPEIEALRPGENGMTYVDGDVRDLARTLRALLGDATLRKRLGEEALATALDRFTLENMVDGFERAIRYCVRNSGKSNAL